jgi:hypothetical protein
MILSARRPVTFVVFVVVVMVFLLLNEMVVVLAVSRCYFTTRNAFGGALTRPVSKSIDIHWIDRFLPVRFWTARSR